MQTVNRVSLLLSSTRPRRGATGNLSARGATGSLSASVLLTTLAVLASAAPRAVAGPVEDLLAVIPGDAPFCIVVADFEKFDKSIATLVKTINPDAPSPGILESMKSDLPIAKWIDFTKPVGMVQANVLGPGEPLLFAVVPGFAEKVKTVADAKEENGVWTIPMDGQDVFAKVKGGYVMASPSADGLAIGTKEGKSLADELKARGDLLKNRDLFLHLNFDPIRPMAAMGLMQASQLAPMLAMQTGAQGADAESMTAAVNGGIEGIKSFVDQVSYLEISAGLSDNDANVTIAAGFKDGAIHDYLGKQKPASAPFLTEVEDQPYLAAMGCHVPGSESPFFDFFFDKISTALTAAPAAAAAVGGTPPADTTQADAAKAAIQVSRDLYHKVEGWNFVVAFTPAGMKVSGDYLGADAPAIAELAKKSVASSNSMMKGMSGGASYESLGKSKLADTEVEQFALKIDTYSPSGAQAAMMLGQNSRFAVGITGGKVRYFMGAEGDAAKAFAVKTEKPLAANKVVADAVAALPAKKNALILIDPAGILPLVGPMMGMPKTDPLPPGPPVGISVSISGEPARFDLHLPYKAITRIMEAFKPAAPPT